MFKTLILVCSLTIPRANCDINSARVMLPGPDATDVMSCMMQTQAYFANTAIEVGKDEYLKIECNPPIGIDKDKVG